ncbi:MAG: class I SAM-dependent methyltransferase, partial [Anaerolineales bacterium]
MQAYGAAFARVYNLRWSGFARQAALAIEGYYRATAAGKENRSVLDVGCGTGQLALHFLERGYRVVGMDLSPAMLDWARRNAARFVESGQAKFLEGDATDFKLDERFGLVVSTFDTLNHLPDRDALRSCFRCVHEVCDHTLVFDLNTRVGLQRRWNNIEVDDGSDDAVVITRGMYDGSGDRLVASQVCIFTPKYPGQHSVLLEPRHPLSAQRLALDDEER